MNEYGELELRVLAAEEPVEFVDVPRASGTARRWSTCAARV